MELTVGGRCFVFRLDPETSRYTSPITLAEWEPFRSKNSVPGREGQDVLLDCPRVFDHSEAEPRLADPSCVDPLHPRRRREDLTAP